MRAAEAVDRFLLAKRDELSVAYRKELKRTVSAFVGGRGDASLAELADVDEVEQWCDARRSGISPHTFGSELGRLSSFFGYATRRRWIAVNPTDFVERPRLRTAEPEILAVGQCRAVLHATEAEAPDLLAWLVAGLFAGVRPREAERMRWCDVRDQRIVLSAAVTKVRWRRIVELQPNARAWLVHARGLGSRLPLPTGTRRRLMRRVRSRMNWPEWPPDALRKTAASMLLGLNGDVSRTATLLGNSPAILMKNYVALVEPPTAADFWSIYPGSNYEDTQR